MPPTVTNPGNLQYKTIIRIEKAVRLENLGINDDDIARHLGMAVASYKTLKGTDEFKAARIRYTTGVLSEMDADLGNDVNYLREKVRASVPAALDVLVKALQHPDAKVAVGAANDLLDRDGHLAKVSRVGLPDEDQGGIGANIDTSVADGLIQTLKTMKGANNVQQANSGTGQTGNNTNSNTTTP